MKKLRMLPAVLIAAALLTPQALAAPTAELVRVFETGGTLYTYVSLTGSDSPITKAEAKLGQQSFLASGPLETVRQAGFPVEYLLLVDNSNSMPPFREEVSAFAAALAETGGEHTSYALASFGRQFSLEGEALEAETLADVAASLPMDETLTRLNTSIVQALDFFDGIPRAGNQLRCLVVLSDGVQYDPQGGVPYDELIERLARSDVMLHCVGLGGDADALERMGGLALASGGTQWTVSGPEEAAQAARGLAQGNGDLLVTGFDINSYQPSGGEEPVSITFASGGELICRGEGSVALSPAEEGDASGQASANPPDQMPPSTPPHAASALEGSQTGSSAPPPAAAIAGGVVALAALAILVFFILYRRKSAAPNAPERSTVPDEPFLALSSVYLRLDVPEGIPVRGDLEWNLTGEIVLGSSPECDVVFGDLETPSWRLRIVLKEGVVWCIPVSGSISVNGNALQTERRMRSADTVSCGEFSFQLKF